MLDLELTGKIAIVTGGSEGMGRAAAERLVREGAKVTICARRKDVLENAASAMRAAGAVPDAILIPCGGGGLSGGIGIAIRDAYPSAAIVLVEPEGFDDYGRSLASGARVSNRQAAGSVCDGLLAPAPGAIGFALNRRHGASSLTVSDDDCAALDTVPSSSGHHGCGAVMVLCSRRDLEHAMRAAGGARFEHASRNCPATMRQAAPAAGRLPKGVGRR